MTTTILLSGGMDSAAIACWRRPEYAFTVDYGQLAAAGEIRAASAVAAALSLKHYVIRADLRELGSGDMAGVGRLSMAPVSEWWPFRNQMLVTLSAMQGIALGVDRLLIGCLATDSQHADGRRAFVEQMDSLLLGQEGAIRLEAPAIELTAEELVRVSGVPIEILSWSHSCHVAEYACGMCRGCRKHYETMAALGATPY